MALVLKSTRGFLSSRLLSDMANGGRYRRKCLRNCMMNTSTATMQGTHGIGEKTDVLDPGSQKVKKTKSTATPLTSPFVSKHISTTIASAPFELYGYALKMWWHNSLVKFNVRHLIAEQCCLASNSFLAMAQQSTCQARRIAIFLCMVSVTTTKIRVLMCRHGLYSGFPKQRLH